MDSYKEQAKTVVDAIRKMASDENSLDNFEGYLSYHFDSWIKKFASTPDGFASEMKEFSEINNDI